MADLVCAVLISFRGTGAALGASGVLDMRVYTRSCCVFLAWPMTVMIKVGITPAVFCALVLVFFKEMLMFTYNEQNSGWNGFEATFFLFQFRLCMHQNVCCCQMHETVGLIMI